jgi:outer membrane usher protein
VRLAFAIAVIAGIHLSPIAPVATAATTQERGQRSDVASARDPAKAQAAQEELWLSVQINHYGPAEPVLLLRLADGRLLARGDDLTHWRLPLPAQSPISSSGQKFYALDALPGLTYTLDEAKQALFVSVPPALFLNTLLNGQVRQFSAASAAPPGAFFNYDVSSQTTSGHVQTGGLFELGLFNSWGVGVGDFLARDYGGGSNVIRLSTTWTQDHPTELASLRVGDAITGSGDWGRSVRFGGVQWATNYATQPGFVPFPLPRFAGEAALPSTMDLFVDDALRMSRNVPPGPFSIINLPVVSGAGDASIVVRDLLGREQLVTLPYYVSPRLLQAGLDDYSYEAGFVRNNFGIDSNDYGRFAAVGTQRRGFTDWLTGEAHAELLRDQQTAGLGSTFLLSSLGVFNASIAASHSTTLGDGGLVALGFERQGRTLSFGGSLQFAGPHFAQLGLQPGALAPRQLSQAFVTLATTDYGSFGLSYAAQIYRKQDSVRLVSASYNVAVAKLGYFTLSAVRVLGNTSATVYNLSFTLPLGERTSASARFNHQGASDQGLVDVQQNLPPGDGFGYRVQFGAGDFTRADAAVSYQNGIGTYSVDATQSLGRTDLRGDVAGSIVTLGGDIFLSRRIDQGFGVVQVPGYPNVNIYADNQVVATTNASGNALVPRLRAYEDNPIRIEQGDLPLDAEIDTLELKAVPALRSGVVVAFPVRRSLGGLIAVVLDDGQPIPAGAVARINGQSQEFPTGMNGQVYLTGLALSNQVRVSWRGQACELLVLFVPSSEPLPQLGTYVCAGVKP